MKQYVEVNSREFRSNLASIFGLADKGEQIIIRRRNKPTYMLTRIEEEDFVLSPEAEKKIELARQQHKEGKGTICRSKEEITQYLDSL